MSAAPSLTLSITGCTPGTPLIANGTPSRRASSRPRSAAGPLTSPVLPSVTAWTGLLAMKVARNVPVGTRSSACPDSIAHPIRTATRAARARKTMTCSSSKPLPRQRRAPAERDELGGGDRAAHRRHAAIGAGDDVLARHVLHRFADRGGDLLGGLDRVARHVDRADQHVLAFEQGEEAHR